MLPEKIKSHLFKALVRPILEYSPNKIIKSGTGNLERLQEKYRTKLADALLTPDLVTESVHLPFINL